MFKLLALLSLAVAAVACSSGPTHNAAMLEKYPACYHKLVKLSNKCIEKNEAGNRTTALELENASFPGQYN